MEHNSTKKRHLALLWPYFIYLAFLILGLAYLSERYGDESKEFFDVFFGVVFILITIPEIALHLRYWQLCRNTVIEIKDMKTIKIKNKDHELSFSPSDIESVEQHQSFNASKGNIYWFPWDGYWYFKIYLKDRRIILIPCLIIRKDTLLGLIKKPEIRPTVYCWPSSSRLIINTSNP